LPYTAKETRRQRMEKNTDDRINLLALVQNEPVGQLSYNEPAIHLYKKFGFEIEGTHRMDTFRDGVYVDTYSMGRLRNI